MKKSTIIHILAFIISGIFHTAINAQIHGIVIDQQSNKALSFANVILINAKDNSIIQGDFTDIDGKFIFKTTSSDEMILRVSMIGYQDFNSSPFSNQEDKEIEINCPLELSDNIIKGVEVVAKIPYLEQTAGKMTVNVAQNISSINGSMLDVLKTVPGILVINKKVSLAGNSNVSILIDGKPTKYLDIQTLLSEMSADDIEKIEVISQAGASMDASGSGGVINIILKKNKLKGTNGSISVGLGKGDLEKYSTNLRLNNRTNKLNINGSLGFSNNNNWESIDIDRKVGQKTYVQSTYQPSKPKTIKLSTGIDWDVKKNHQLGISMRGFVGTNNRVNNSHTDIREANTILETVSANNSIDRSWNYFNGDIYYNWAIDTTGQKLSISSNFSSYNRNASSLNEINNNTNNYYPNQKNNQPGETQISAYKIDYTLPLNKNIVLTSGAKFSHASIDNILNAYSSEGSSWKLNPFLTNHYIFSETTKAAYLQASFIYKKISFKTGLRYEDSKSEGYSVTLDSTTTRNIDNLFPSASMDFPLNKTLGISAAYSYRIQRPSYHTLNPFISYFDPFSYEKGNPNLGPALTHSSKISLTYNKQPFFNLQYAQTKDVIMSVTEQDDVTGASYLTTTNMDKYERLGASLFMPLNMIPHMDGYCGVITSYNMYESGYLDDSYEKNKFSLITFIQGSVNLSKGFKFEFGGWYNSGGLEGIMEHEDLFGTGVGIEKKLLDNQLSLKLEFENPFYKYWTADIKFKNMDAVVTSKWETKVVNFKASYKFGNRYLKKSKNKKSSAEEESRRVNKDL